ncbi:RNA-binding protein [Paenibacillus swuensis]|uniref:RNA-binding protein n=1 Tax=Paenibacillus swuensis TaxID=1178515 RepID=A0A172TJN1_9BACL|nr:S1-like domain-containing RNA-binding protein [Paenibacillus swuensis]ANE47269.1 RNA-binding protein [Paenibacillus swuensis]
MSLTAGTIVKLKVNREVSPFGFFVGDGEEELLMPYSDANTKVRVGDNVEVFIHHDTDDRMMATMRRPVLTLGEMALLQVADIHPRLGCFLEMGLGRQMLLPNRQLPELHELRPLIGDHVYAVMGHDKQGRLLAKLATEDELIERCFHAPSSWKGQWMEAVVYKPLQMGTFVVVEGGVLGFGAIGMIHASERVGLPRLGERVKVRVAFIREDGRVNLSMKQPKEVGRDDDAELLLAFIKERPNGGMPYSDATAADLIQTRFGISKSAFKRAVGKLMKEGLVYQEGSWTYLTANREQAGQGANQEPGESEQE